MPDDIKPDESSEEQVNPDEESSAVGTADNKADPEAAEASSPSENDKENAAENSPEEGGDEEGGEEVMDNSAADAEAAEAMRKMLEEDDQQDEQAESRPDLEDEFPDLSQVKSEETMASPAEFQQLSPSRGEGKGAGNIDLLLDVRMPIAIELGRTEMAISEILSLGPGSVVELNKLAGEPVDLLVNGKTVARGEVVVVDENFGVRITMLMSPEERLKSMSE